MYNIWRKIPVLRILIPFSAGILLEMYLPLPITFWLTGSLFFFLLLSVLTGWKALRYNAKLLFSLVFHFQLLCFAGSLTQLKTVVFHPDHFGKFVHIELVDGVLSTDPEETANSYKTTVFAKQVMADGEIHKTSGEFILYISKAAEINWHKGDRIFISRSPVPIRSAGNPNEFDYRKYLFNHGITHQLFLRDPSDAILLKKEYVSSPLKIFDHTRKWMVDKLRGALPDDDAFAVSSALILGQKEFLTPQIKSSYSGTGAMHILAVSGLHVGIIYLIIRMFIRWLGSSKWSMLFKLFVIIAGLWSYAIITGLSPSVLRAATMFSAVAIAQNIGRRSNIYNTLATAALILLCYNPYLLLNVGFQLSFIAVLGIVLIQPPVYRLMVFKSKIGDQIWQLLSVSLAAQIATFPLGILYFNQFPNYFLLTNLIVIPAAFVILKLGVALMISTVFTPLYDLLGFLLNELVYYLNFSVQFIDALPFATTRGLVLSTPESVAIYLLIGFIILLIYRKHVHFLLATIACTLFLLSSYTFRLYERVNHPVIVVHNISGMTGLSFVDGNQNILLADSSLIHDQSKQNYHLSSFWFHRGFKEATLIDIRQDSIARHPGFIKQGNFISFHGYRIKVISDYNESHSEITPKVDLLVMTERSKIERQENFHHIALSSSYRYRKLCCDTTTVTYTDVRSQGALVINLNKKAHSQPEPLLAGK